MKHKLYRCDNIETYGVLDLKQSGFEKYNNIILGTGLFHIDGFV